MKSSIKIIALFCFMPALYSLQRTAASRVVRPASALLSRPAATAAPRIAQASRTLSTMPSKIDQGKSSQNKPFDYETLGYGIAMAASLGATGYMLQHGSSSKKEIIDKKERERLERETLVINEKMQKLDKKFSGKLLKTIDTIETPQEMHSFLVDISKVSVTYSLLFGRNIERSIESADLFSIFDYLKIHKKDIFIAEFKTFLPFLLSGWYYDGTIKKDDLKRWFLENPDYFKDLLHAIKTFCRPLERVKWFFDIKDLLETLFDVCNTLIIQPAHASAIINFIEFLKMIVQENQDLFERINFYLDYQKYPHLLIKSKKEYIDYSLRQKMSDFYEEEIRQLRELFSLQKKREHRFLKHTQESVLLENKHLEELFKKKPFKLREIASSKSADQFLSALSKAADLNNKGYISFYHGQNNSYALLNDIGTDILYRLAHEEKRNDFNFLRIKSKDFSLRAEKNEKTDEIISNILIQQRPRELFNSGHGEDYLASNFFAFGNSEWPGNSTFYYVENKYNENVNNQNTSLLFKNILKNSLDIPDPIIDKIMPKFKKLLTTADKTYQTGRLVLLAIPYNVVDERVYTFNYFGPSLEGKPIPHMSEILEKVSRDSEIVAFENLDSFHCVMPLTIAGMLNPYNDIKIINFDNPVSKQAEKELEKAKQELLDEIIKLLKESGRLEKSQEIAKNYFTLLKDVHEEEEKILRGEE